MNKQIEIIGERITAAITAELERGVIPWRQPWNDTLFTAYNGVSKKQYNMGNLYLSMLPYKTKDYYTFKQARELGGNVKKGEHGNIASFYTAYVPEEFRSLPENEQKKHAFPVVRSYIVFNREQCEGLPDLPKTEKREINPIDAAEKIITGYSDKPSIVEGIGEAYYSPGKDYVAVPARSAFEKLEEFYSTLFHELTHSTGHDKRLAREGFAVGKFGSNEYSKEELVAELGAAILCGLCGIDNSTIKNSSAYIGSWLKRLNNDKTLFYNASRLAVKAVDYMRKGAGSTTAAEAAAPSTELIQEYFNF